MFTKKKSHEQETNTPLIVPNVKWCRIVSEIDGTVGTLGESDFMISNAQYILMKQWSFFFLANEIQCDIRIGL